MGFLKATILISSFAVLSKILGAAKFMALGHNLGAGRELDIYVAAFRIPDLLFNLLILGTLSAAFIPVFAGYWNRDRQEALAIASTVWNIALAVMGALSLLGFVLAPYFMDFLVPGFDEAAKEETARLTRILMLSPLLFTLSSILTGILHSLKRFLAAAVAPLFYNLSIIAGILFFYEEMGLAAIAWGAVLGALIHFLIQFPPALKLGFRPFRHFAVFHPGLRKILKLFLPRILALDLGQISFLVATIIGSALAAGSIAGFYFAYEINTIPLGIFAMAFSIAAFPTMAEFLNNSDMAGFRHFFKNTAVQILFIMVPVSVILLLLRAQIVRLIPGAFEGTKFTFEDTRLTAQLLGFFTLSLFAQSLVPLLTRAFFAMQNTVTPLIVSVFSAAVNVVLGIVLSRFFGAMGLAAAFSISYILNMLILITILHGRVGEIADEFLLVKTIKIAVASVVMGAAVFVALYAVAHMVNMQTYLGILLQSLSGAFVGVIIYLAAGWLIGLAESTMLIAVVKNWFSKFSRPVVSAVINLFSDYS